MKRIGQKGRRLHGIDRMIEKAILGRAEQIVIAGRKVSDSDAVHLMPPSQRCTRTGRSARYLPGRRTSCPRCEERPQDDDERPFAPCFCRGRAGSWAVMLPVFIRSQG